jgi:hypothetical protein
MGMIPPVFFPAESGYTVHSLFHPDYPDDLFSADYLSDEYRRTLPVGTLRIGH